FIQVSLFASGCVCGIYVQGKLSLFKTDAVAAGENLVATFFFIPLGQGSGHMHLLDDIAPADTSVVCAEGNFTLLRGVRNDAHFCSAEIVIEQILEPHTRDKQEIPAIVSSLLDVLQSGIAADLAVIVP